MQPKLSNSQMYADQVRWFVNWRVLAAFDYNMPTNLAGLWIGECLLIWKLVKFSQNSPIHKSADLVGIQKEI
jgi:hypothetical protein